MAARRPELRLGERERSRRDIAGALVAERTVPPKKLPSIGKTVFFRCFSDFLGRHQESMRKCKKVRQSSTLVCALSMSAPLSVDPRNPPSYDFSELNASSFRFRGRQFHGACAPPFKFCEFMGPWNEVPGSED